MSVMLAAMVAVSVAVVTSISRRSPTRCGWRTGSCRAWPASAAGVRAFKGIPFAAPPVGENRWRAPQPAAKWDGVRAGDAFGNRCIAGGGFGGGRGAAAGRGRGGAPARRRARARGCSRRSAGGRCRSAPVPQPPAAEDCLYLNVWTSATNASDRRPVMVWIYGGGFTGGSGVRAALRRRPACRRRVR